MPKQQAIGISRGVARARKSGIVALIALLSISPARFIGVTSFPRLSGFYRGDGYRWMYAILTLHDLAECEGQSQKLSILSWHLCGLRTSLRKGEGDTEGEVIL